MNTLELEKPESKIVFVVLTKKENNALLNEQRYNLCEDVLNEHTFDFVTVDMEGESKFNPKSLVKIIGKCPIRSHGVDIPEFAKGYMQEEIDELQERVTGLEMEYSTTDQQSFKGQNLASWIAVIHEEIEEKQVEMETVIKPKWMVKQILEHAANTPGDEVYVLHFGTEKSITAMKAAFDEINGTKASILDARRKTMSPSIFA